MNAYAEFKADFFTELSCNVIPESIIEKVMESMEKIMTNYEISKVSTDIITVDIPRSLNYFLTTMKLEGRSDETIYSYNKLLCAMFRMIRKPENEISSNDIWSFLLNYQNTRKNPVQKSTIEHYRVILSSYFSWAKSNGYIVDNPMDSIKPIKCEKRVRHSMDRNELDSIMNACETLKEKAFVMLLYFSGCRVMEMVDMKLSDINWNNLTITVIGKGDKERIVNFNSETAECMKEYIATRNDDCDYLFVSDRGSHHVTTKSMREWLQKITSRCELNTHVTPHVVRHTTATLAIEQGMPINDVQRMLGHSDVKTTMRYIDDDKLNLRNSYDKYVI